MSMLKKIISVAFLFSILYKPADAQEKYLEKPYKTKKEARLETNFSKLTFDTSHTFDVLHYCLDLKFPLKSSSFSGTATLTFCSRTQGLKNIKLHMVDLLTDSVLMWGNRVPVAQEQDTINISLGKTIARDDTFSISIFYRGTPEEKGFYFYSMCAYTMSEPEDARYWFPCYDVPWDKATAELHVTVPKGIEVASIGLLESRDISQDGLWETFHWRTQYPVSTYLICVTMSANYARWSDWYVTEAGDSIEIAYYIFKRDSTEAAKDFVHMVHAMTFFSGRFGPYPFEKYGMAEVEPFQHGGMEHQTMSTINSVWIRGNREYEHGMVHELAHMWWGDAVTLNDWPAIWMNEGFATYSEALFIEHKYNKISFENKMSSLKKTYFSQAESRDFSLYDPPTRDLFNYGVVYSKGAWVLHMLRYVVGEENFWRILNTYYETYRYGNASIPEFQRVCEKVSGINLSWFFEEWIYSAGYPKIKYSWNGCSLSSHLFDIQVQVNQVQTEENLFRMPVDVRVECNRTTTDTTIWVEKSSQLFTFHVQDEPQQVYLDPEGWILMDSELETWKDTEPGQVPDRFYLYPSFPNPFNETTTIFYSVPESKNGRKIRLVVYNLLGKKIRTLIEKREMPGDHRAVWDGKDEKGIQVSSGIYLVELSSENFSQRIKVVLVR